jgi:hypothetical protein
LVDVVCASLDATAAILNIDPVSELTGPPLFLRETLRLRAGLTGTPYDLTGSPAAWMPYRKC